MDDEEPAGGGRGGKGRGNRELWEYELASDDEDGKDDGGYVGGLPGCRRGG